MRDKAHFEQCFKNAIFFKCINNEIAQVFLAMWNQKFKSIE